MRPFNPNLWKPILSALGIVQSTYIATLSNEISGTNPNTMRLYGAMARLAGILFIEAQLIKDIILRHIQERKEWAELLKKYEEHELVTGLEELIKDNPIELEAEDKKTLNMLFGYYQAVTRYDIAKTSFVLFMEAVLKPRVIALHVSMLGVRDELVKILSDPSCCSHVGPAGRPLAFHELAGHLVKFALTPRLTSPDPADTRALDALPVPKFEPISDTNPGNHWLVTQMLEQIGYALKPDFFIKKIPASCLHESQRQALGLTSVMVTVAEALNGLMRLQHGIMQDAHDAYQKLVDAHRDMEFHPGKPLLKPSPEHQTRHHALEEMKERLMDHIRGLGQAPDDRPAFQPTPGAQPCTIKPPWVL